MPPIMVIAAAGLAVAVGGLLQSGLGLGLGLVGAPMVTLLAPSLMPGAMLIAGASLPLLMLVREARHTDWHGVSWALAGRVAGTVGGVWLVAVISVRALGLVVGTVVLAVVVASWLNAAVPKNRWTLLTAGVVSGTTATATSIGGPPIALIYQRESGPQVRATLSAFFCVGNVLALTGLAATGHLPARDIDAGLLFIGCALAGFAAATRLRGFLDDGRTRAAVLVVAAASAVVLIIHGA
ncbi:MAG TPA: sulfite exporter TauE/SafE family protein [Streptosporangiaceae bacterium]|nr:sulfite exporter TauE/SafE family protein [Streptosporangiaceae bacterium]